MPLTRVYKYRLELGDLITVQMPRGSRLLHFDAQHEEFYV